MSYVYERVERRRRTGGGSSFGASGKRSTFGYWVPLALTVTAATIGLAAWIWSERKDDEEYSSEEDQTSDERPPPGYGQMGGAFPPGPDPSGFQGPPPGPMGPSVQDGSQIPPAGPWPGPGPGGEAQSYYQGASLMSQPQAGPNVNLTARSTALGLPEDSSIVSRMSGAMKRAPSPQQSYDWASTKLAAGVAAAGAIVGGALSSITEGNVDGYEDHERWSEEAEGRDGGKVDVKQGIKRRGTSDEYFSGQVEMPKQATFSRKKRKTVAIVVSAVQKNADGPVEVGHHAVSLKEILIFATLYTHTDASPSYRICLNTSISNALVYSS